MTERNTSAPSEADREGFRDLSHERSSGRRDRVLVVDDDRSIRRTLEKLLVAENMSVCTAADGAEAIAAIERDDLDAVLLDLSLPVVDGLHVLSATQSLARRPPVVVISAREDMQSTVLATQLGAHDYLIKPLDIDRLKHALRLAIASRSAPRSSKQFAAAASTEPRRMVGRSATMREVYKMVGAVSTARAVVLITGESGTGKELIAHAVHDSGPDRDKPFVAVNCTAFSRDLLESELFGHVRGAFTGAINERVGRFELAGAGTIFLDEIAEIPLDLQPKLLRVLQERVFERVGDSRPTRMHARVIAATHRDLPALVRAGQFREDLWYRLRVVEIRLPPLRERVDDLEPLIEHLLAKINRDLHKAVTYVTAEALAQMRAYDWPGNVRELENALTRAVVLTRGPVLDAGLLDIPVRESLAASDERAERPAIAEPILPLHEVERRHIARTLAHVEWNKRRACALLEISRPTLDRKIDAYALKSDKG